MRFALALTLILAGGSAGARAQSGPYLATVTGSNATLYAGPSEQFPKTETLNSGDQLLVDHEEPNGWLAVQAPAGRFYSLSWVAIQFVSNFDKDKPTPQNVVTVGEAGDLIALAPGSMGSNVPLTYYSKTKVPVGTVLTVVGPKVLNQGRSWYPIAPPPGDFRYIAKQLVKAEKPVNTSFTIREGSEGGTVPAASIPSPRSGNNIPPQPLTTPVLIGPPVGPATSTPPTVVAGARSGPPPSASSGGGTLPPAAPVPGAAASASSTGGTLPPFAPSPGASISTGSIPPSLPPAAPSTPPPAPAPVVNNPLWAQAEAAEQAGRLDDAEKLYFQLAREMNEPGGDHDTANLCYTRIHAIREKKRAGATTPPGTATTAPRPLAGSPQQSKAISATTTDAAKPNDPSKKPNYMGTGKLTHSALDYLGFMTYALETSPGEVTYYVLAGPGVDLEKYRNKRVDIYGSSTIKKDLSKPLVVATEVAPAQ